MTKIPLFLAQAQSPAPAGAPAPTGLTALLMNSAPLILMFAAMYFLLIAPQRKKQKEHERMLTELKAGDEVVTTGGIYGTIVAVRDDRFVVRISENNVKVEVGKSFIGSVVSRADAA